MKRTTTINDLLDGPPRHLERYAPPWVADRRTICGRPLADVAAWVTYDEGRKLIDKVGATRARLLLCQTCLGQQSRIASPTAWERNPAAIVEDYTRNAVWEKGPAFEQTRAELLAIARLIEQHPDEYEALWRSYLTDDLRARRARR